MKKFFTMMLVCTALLTMTTGCSDDDTDTPTPQPGQEPSIQTETTLNLVGDGGEYSLTYSIENPVKGEEILAESDDSWISEIRNEGSNTIKFKYEALEGAKAREGKLTLSYATASPVEVKLLQTQDKLTFKVTIIPESISSIGCEMKIIPSEPDVPYMVAFINKAAIDRCASDEEFIAEDIQFWKELAESQGATLQDALKQFTVMGESTRTVNDLNPETEYYGYVYGVSYEGEILSRLYKVQFSTTKVQDSNCTFKLTYHQENVAPYPDNNVYNVSVTITPSDPEIPWTYAPMNSYVYSMDEWTDESYEKFIRENIAQAKPVMFVGEQTLTLEQMMGGLRVWGGTEYYVWLFGTDSNYHINTKIQKETIKTNEIPILDDCKFDIRLNKISSQDVDFTVTPTNNDTKYFIGLYPGHMVGKYGASTCAERLLQRIDLGHFDEEGTILDWETNHWIHRGELTTQLGKGEGWNLQPSKAYTMIIFGFDNYGHRTTEVAVKDFSTTEYTPTEDFKLDFEVVELGTRTIEVNVIPSDDETWYYTGLTTAENFDQYHGDWNAFLEALIHANGVNLPTTVGPETIKTNATPGTEHVVFGFAYANGKAQSEYFSYRLKTKELPRNYNVDVDAKWGFYRGSELAALHPDVYGDYASEPTVFVFELTPKNAETTHYYGLLHQARSIMELPDMLIFDYFENYPLGWKDSKLGRYRAPGVGPFGFFWAGQDAQGAWGTLHYEEITVTEYSDAKNAPVGEFIEKESVAQTTIMAMPVRQEPQIFKSVSKPQSKKFFKEITL